MRKAILSLPVEILQLITEHLRDVDTLVIWSQVCTFTRELCRSPFGEQIFRSFLNREVVYADEARLASRILYLDLQTHAWTRPEISRWTFNGEVIDKQWYARVLSWPASFIYSICLDRADHQHWIPWVFEYKVLLVNHKVLISILCSEWYVNNWRGISELASQLDREDFEAKDAFRVTYATSFYRLRTWDILSGADECELRGKSWGTSFSGSSVERLRRTEYLDYICDRCDASDGVPAGALALCQLLVHYDDISSALLRVGVFELDCAGPLEHAHMRRVHHGSLIEDKPSRRSIFYMGHVATLMERDAAVDRTYTLRVDALNGICTARKEQLEHHHYGHRLATLTTRFGHPERTWLQDLVERVLQEKYDVTLSHAWYKASWGYPHMDFERYALGGRSFESKDEGPDLFTKEDAWAAPRPVYTERADDALDGLDLDWTKYIGRV